MNTSSKKEKRTLAKKAQNQLPHQAKDEEDFVSIGLNCISTQFDSSTKFLRKDTSKEVVLSETEKKLRTMYQNYTSKNLPIGAHYNTGTGYEATKAHSKPYLHNKVGEPFEIASYNPLQIIAHIYDGGSEQRKKENKGRITISKNISPIPQGQSELEITCKSIQEKTLKYI